MLLEMKTKKMFFLYGRTDREELHNLYGGKQYYSSRSGLSGAGYICPKENTFIEIKGTYRAYVPSLSEAWPAQMFEISHMVPVEGIKRDQPAVVLKNNTLWFLERSEYVIRMLEGKDPFENADDETYTHQVNYKYLNRSGKISEFGINWAGACGFDRNFRPSGIPGCFEAYVQKMGQIPCVKYAEFLHEEEESFLLKKMYLAKTECGLARIGAFGLPVELIEGELFPEDESRILSNGWVTQGFGPFKIGYKRVSNGEKIYAVIEAVPGEIDQKYSVLGNIKMEYELICENVLNWFSEPLSTWVDGMKEQLVKKIKSQYTNVSRWNESEQKKLVQDLLRMNPEVMFTIDDSLKTGNCLPGTQEFMDRNLIKEPISAQSLLDHKRFSIMLENARFRAVVIGKIFADPDYLLAKEESASRRGRGRNNIEIIVEEGVYDESYVEEPINLDDDDLVED